MSQYSVFTHCIVTHYTHCIIKNAETYLHLDIVKSTVMAGLRSVLNEQSSWKDIWMEG